MQAGKDLDHRWIGDPHLDIAPVQVIVFHHKHESLAAIDVYSAARNHQYGRPLTDMNPHVDGRVRDQVQAVVGYRAEQFADVARAMSNHLFWNRLGTAAPNAIGMRVPEDLSPSRNHPDVSGGRTTFHSWVRCHESNSLFARDPGLDFARAPPEGRRAQYPAVPGSHRSASLFRAIGRPLRLEPAPADSVRTHAVWRPSGPPAWSMIHCHGATVPEWPGLFANPQR